MRHNQEPRHCVIDLLLIHIIIRINLDPRTNHWPLISSPVPGATILAAYLYFVISWGPRYMANRKPYNLERTLIIYNFIQVIVSTYIFYEVIITIKWIVKELTCFALVNRTSLTVFFCFVFFLSIVFLGCISWMVCSLQLEMSTSEHFNWTRWHSGMCCIKNQFKYFLFYKKTVSFQIH